jgi:hypothetical protein
VSKYNVKTRFVFDGEFNVKAACAADARLVVDEYCSACGLKAIESQLNEGEVDWDFPVHPEKIIDRVRRILCSAYWKSWNRIIPCSLKTANLLCRKQQMFCKKEGGK